MQDRGEKSPRGQKPRASVEGGELRAPHGTQSCGQDTAAGGAAAGRSGVLPERSFSQGARSLAENEDAFSPLVSPL